MSTTLATRHPLAIPSRHGENHDIDYHVKEWTSGQQGGGHIPDDFDWGSNPKQNQEENGASQLNKRGPGESK